MKQYDKQYRNNNIDKLRYYDGERYGIKLICQSCNKEVSII